jgi:hypothetical protein
VERNPYLTEREQRELAEIEQLLAAGDRRNARDGGPQTPGADRGRADRDQNRHTH